MITIKKIIYILIITTLLCACTYKNNTTTSEISSNKSTTIKSQFFFLNSILSLNILDENVDKEEILSKVQARVQELEEKFTLNSNDSEVSKINNNIGTEAIAVSNDTYKVIKNSIIYSEMSKGKFDITVGNLVKLWGIGTKDEHIPSEDDIKFALSTIDYKKIILDDDNKSVFLQDDDMMIDLGAIAKGYVTDEIVSILKKNNVKSAIINLGGNVYVHGNKKGKDFNVGIRNPLSPDPNSYFAICSISNQSMVTSGVYERYFEQDGIRYHHILSTATGYPIDNELISTTIICPNSMQADALSTTTFALGLEDGLALIENTENVEAIFVTKDKKVYTSSGINDKLKLSDNDYILAK